jgi:hypothetical protein
MISLRHLRGSLLVLLAGCASSSTMDIYVPAHCHGVVQSFESYTLGYENIPGFIQGVIDTSLNSALENTGLLPSTPEQADLRIVSSFNLIDRNPIPQPEDPFGEEVQTSEINRFVTHLQVEIFDARSGQLIWTGAMYRAHAIEGGETFHNEKAVLMIREAFDQMFVGLTSPCE